MQGAATGAAWQSVLQKAPFADPHGGDSATLLHLCSIFAARNSDVWKAPDVLAWLLRCAEYAADAATASLNASQDEGSVRVHVSQIHFADARTLTTVTYPASEENEYAHLSTPSFTDARPTLPPEQIAALQGQGPPGDADEMAAGELRALLRQLGTAAGGHQRGAGQAVRLSAVLCTEFRKHLVVYAAHRMQLWCRSCQR